MNLKYVFLDIPFILFAWTWMKDDSLDGKTISWQILSVMRDWASEAVGQTLMLPACFLFIATISFLSDNE